MRTGFNVFTYLIIFGTCLQCLIQVTLAGWSDCPQNLKAYEGCPYTIDAIFTATNNLTCGIYHFSVNWEMPMSVMPINGSDSRCKVSMYIASVTNVIHNVTFRASISQDDTPVDYIPCQDILQICNDTLSTPTNLTAIVTCHQLHLSWTQPDDLLEGYSIHNYTVVINNTSCVTNDTSISISITDAELSINEEYNVSITPSYCRGEGMTAYTTVVIANRPALEKDTSYTYSGDSNHKSLVLVQLSAQVASNSCEVSHPTSVTLISSCGNVDTMPKDVTVNNDGSITTNVTLPINEECHVDLVFSNSNAENTTINTTIYTDNLRNCYIQEILPIELNLVHFKCDCIHGGCECCNITSTDVILLVWSTGVSGYLQLPAGNHTVECISLNTSRMVSERYISLMEGNNSICSIPSTTSTTHTTTSTDLSTCISPSIDSIMDAECDCNEKFCCYVGLPAMGILVLILAVVTITLFLKQKTESKPATMSNDQTEHEEPAANLYNTQAEHENNRSRGKQIEKNVNPSRSHDPTTSFTEVSYGDNHDIALQQMLELPQQNNTTTQTTVKQHETSFMPDNPVSSENEKACMMDFDDSDDFSDSDVRSGQLQPTDIDHVKTEAPTVPPKMGEDTTKL